MRLQGIRHTPRSVWYVRAYVRVSVCVYVCVGACICIYIYMCERTPWLDE
jgi:hypothetical protein